MERLIEDKYFVKSTFSSREKSHLFSSFSVEMRTKAILRILRKNQHFSIKSTLLQNKRNDDFTEICWAFYVKLYTFIRESKVFSKAVSRKWISRNFVFWREKIIRFSSTVHKAHCKKREILSYRKNISWNQLFNFFSKNIANMKFPSKQCESKCSIISTFEKDLGFDEQSTYLYSIVEIFPLFPVVL